MSDERDVRTTGDTEEKEDETKVVDPDLILGDEVVGEDEELAAEAKADEEDEEGLDESDINPFGDKWEV